MFVAALPAGKALLGWRTGSVKRENAQRPARRVNWVCVVADVDTWASYASLVMRLAWLTDWATVDSISQSITPGSVDSESVHPIHWPRCGSIGFYDALCDTGRRRTLRHVERSNASGLNNDPRCPKGMAHCNPMTASGSFLQVSGLQLQPSNQSREGGEQGETRD